MFRLARLGRTPSPHFVPASRVPLPHRSLRTSSNSTPRPSRPIPEAPLVTAVSYLLPPHITTHRFPELGASPDARHVLEVDLSYAEAKYENALSVKDFDDPSIKPNFRSYLQNIAYQDQAAELKDKIDYVRISATNPLDPPSPETYVALDGINPKYLDLVAGADGVCNVKDLDRLETPWSQLQNLHLENVINDLDSPDDLPSVFAHLESLTMEYCADIRFAPPRGLDHLRMLKIINNNALDMFMFAFDLNPKLKNSLQDLHITSTNGPDLTHGFYSADFQSRLKQCTSIRELSLSLAHKGLDIGLAPFLPESVQTLIFRASCTPQMFNDLDVWLEYIRKDDWLPKLTSISMPVEELPGHPHHDVAPTELSEFEGKMKMFLDEIRTRRPHITITI